MGLAYYYTCPQIDGCIDEVKGSIYQTIDNVLEEACPLWIGGSDRAKFIESYTKSLYDSISELFEKVRETNSEMRKVAEDKIDDLEREIENLEEVISDLQTEINRLEE